MALRISGLSLITLLVAAVFPGLFFPAYSPAPFGHPPLVAALAGFDIAANDAAFDENAEGELARLANEERTRRGLPALAVDDRLTQTARAHAQEMAKRKQLSHQFPGEPDLRHRIAQTSIRIKRVGENVGYDSSVESAHQGFMNSSRHRENILRPEYNAIGIGVARRGSTLYVAQNFAQRVGESSSVQVEDQVAAAFERLRRDAGAPPLARLRNAELRELACSMARQDRLQTQPALRLPGVRYVTAYTETEPQNLPPSAAEKGADSALEKFSVGACFQRTPRHPSGMYWVLMVFY
jgi:hypothetical protein